MSESRRALAVGFAVLMLGFFSNMIYVATARVVLLYVPVLLIVFAFRYFTRTPAIWFLTATIAITALLSFTSPYVRQRVEFALRDYKLDLNNVIIAGASNDPSPNGPIATSSSMRLAYWRASIASIAEAPLFGHGTGSTKQLFDREAKGKSGEWANAIRNPHNQTLYVAIQWGMLGCVILFGMWYSHLLLFRGSYLPAWIGFVVVVQNVIGSLLNSHLFDFHEGWIYVLGVGVAGGMARAKGDSSKTGLPSA
jgi:O-antigen ligase